MKILLIEDETKLADSIIDYLDDNGFVCECASTVSTALELIHSYQYDCILLDLSLPDGNGFTILKKLKELNKEEGVIIISARDTIESKIDGLSLGADDYLVKPFHLAELMIRIMALIRRRKFDGKNVIVQDDLEINLLSKEVKVNSSDVDVTKKEFELLLFLIGNKNKVLSKGIIAEHLSGDMADMLDNHDFIYAHVKNLRQKLLKAGSHDYIKSIYGLGYKWSNE